MKIPVFSWEHTKISKSKSQIYWIIKELYCNISSVAYFKELLWFVSQVFFVFFFLTWRLVNSSSLLLSFINYYRAYLVILPGKLEHDTFLILHKIVLEAVNILVHLLDFWIFLFHWSVCTSVWDVVLMNFIYKWVREVLCVPRSSEFVLLNTKET